MIDDVGTILDGWFLVCPRKAYIYMYTYYSTTSSYNYRTMYIQKTHIKMGKFKWLPYFTKVQDKGFSRLFMGVVFFFSRKIRKGVPLFEIVYTTQKWYWFIYLVSLVYWGCPTEVSEALRSPENKKHLGWKHQFSLWNLWITNIPNFGKLVTLGTLLESLEGGGGFSYFPH